MRYSIARNSTHANKDAIKIFALFISLSLIGMDMPVSQKTASLHDLKPWINEIKAAIENTQQTHTFMKGYHYSVNQLNDLVTIIRSRMKKETLQEVIEENDAFNLFLINALSKKFSIDPTYVAGIINTPASRRFINDPTTYLTVLPEDILKIIQKMKAGETDFDQLDNAIILIKAFASQKPELQKKLFSDASFNKQLIKELTQNYKLSPAEVALMLNTPAALELLEEMLLPDSGEFGGKGYVRLEDVRSKINRTIKEYLEKILKTPSKKNQQEKAHDAVRYVKRFLNHPFVQKKNVFHPDIYDFYLRDILVPIYSIELGLYDFPNRHDSFQDWSANAHITQEYLDIAIRFFADPIALQMIVTKINSGRDFSESIYTMQKTLAKAFKDKNSQSVNFILAVFIRVLADANFRIDKDTFTKYDKEFHSYGDRYKITFQEFINSIIAYIQSNRDYTILDKLKKILVAQDLKIIATVLLKYNIDQKTLTKELLAQFISLGLDINEPDQSGQYPLIRAISSKSASMVAEVLATGKINVQICQDGHNALWYVENTEGMNFADRQGMIDLLKRAGLTEQEEKCVIQ